MIQSIVTKTNPRKAYQIPSNVSLRVLDLDEILSQPHEEEVAITIPAFYCGLRVSFPVFLLRFFKEASMHLV